MPRKKAKNLGGRPKVEINWEIAKRACQLQCTGEEVASLLEIDYDTLNRRITQDFLDQDGKPLYPKGFTDYFKIHSANGRASLRRKQFETALAGNATMQIWLGKQYLGQTDKVEQQLDNSVTINVKPASEFIYEDEEEDDVDE